MTKSGIYSHRNPPGRGQPEVVVFSHQLFEKGLGSAGAT
jgi:hypothetical protein